MSEESLNCSFPLDKWQRNLVFLYHGLLRVKDEQAAANNSASHVDSELADMSSSLRTEAQDG